MRCVLKPILLAVLLLAAPMTRAEPKAGVDDLIAAIEAADLPALSQTDPFRAAAWCGVAANVEKLKRALAQDGSEAAAAAARAEAEARIAVLHGKRVKRDETKLDLLNLTGEPRAQVVVEYPRVHGSWVSFYQGALPLASVQVEQHGSAKDARAYVQRPTKWGFRFMAEPVGVLGRKAWAMDQAPEHEATSWDNHDVENEAVLVFDSGLICLIPLDLLDNATTKSICYLPDAPEPAKKRVETWNKDQELPVLGWVAAMHNRPALFLGEPEKVPVFDPALVPYRFSIGQGTRQVSVALGDRTYNCAAPSDEVAVMAIQLAARKKPVREAQVAELAERLCKDLGPTDTPAADTSLYAGDVHTHTFYSDGSCSPLGLVTQMMYCYMDYGVISDHNFILGAQRVTKLADAQGLAFPIIVGEEITTSDYHFNAYPVTELIDARLSDQESVDAAHAQGAVVQWNHPGFPRSDWDVRQQTIGAAALNIEAYEHYDEDGNLAALPGNEDKPFLGSTDTHTGTFEYVERTLFAGPAPTGAALANAVRKADTCALLWEAPGVLSGTAGMRAKVAGLYAAGDAARKLKADRIAAYLRDADLPAMLRAGEDAPVDYPEAIQIQR